MQNVDGLKLGVQELQRDLTLRRCLAKEAAIGALNAKISEVEDLLSKHLVAVEQKQPGLEKVGSQQHWIYPKYYYSITSYDTCPKSWNNLFYYLDTVSFTTLWYVQNESLNSGWVTNSLDPDEMLQQTEWSQIRHYRKWHLIRVYTVCHSSSSTVNLFKFEDKCGKCLNIKCKYGIYSLDLLLSKDW